MTNTDVTRLEKECENPNPRAIVVNIDGRQIEITSKENKAAAEDLLFRAWIMFILTHSNVTPSKLSLRLLEIEQSGFSHLKNYMVKNIKNDAGKISEEICKEMTETLAQGFCFMQLGK